MPAWRSTTRRRYVFSQTEHPSICTTARSVCRRSNPPFPSFLAAHAAHAGLHDSEICQAQPERVSVAHSGARFAADRDVLRAHRGRADRCAPVVLGCIRFGNRAPADGTGFVAPFSELLQHAAKPFLREIASDEYARTRRLRTLLCRSSRCTLFADRRFGRYRHFGGLCSTIAAFGRAMSMVDPNLRVHVRPKPRDALAFITTRSIVVSVPSLPPHAARFHRLHSLCTKSGCACLGG